MLQWVAAASLACCLCAPLQAAPRSYALDPAGSDVQFLWMFGSETVSGHIPVDRADLTIDFDNLARSRVAVAADVTRVDAGFPFASQAMKGPRMLDAARFPQISFQSGAVTRNGTGTAVVDGQITAHGVTRPMRFAAEIYRKRGSAAGDLSQLTVLLTGSLRRSEFGATGWADAVGDVVRLRVIAALHRVD